MTSGGIRDKEDKKSTSIFINNFGQSSDQYMAVVLSGGQVAFCRILLGFSLLYELGVID